MTPLEAFVRKEAYPMAPKTQMKTNIGLRLMVNFARATPSTLDFAA
jgi:hypothetical protein